MSVFWLDPWEGSGESQPRLSEVMCGFGNAVLAYNADSGEIYSRLIGVEYLLRSKDHFDGVSEWCCPDCGVRVGRWSGRVLADGETEPRNGERR